MSYLQKADVSNTAYYSDTVSLQSNIYKKCIREDGKDLESFEAWMKIRKNLATILKSFFKLAVSYIQKDDLMSNA